MKRLLFLLLMLALLLSSALTVQAEGGEKESDWLNQPFANSITWTFKNGTPAAAIWFYHPQVPKTFYDASEAKYMRVELRVSDESLLTDVPFVFSLWCSTTIYARFPALKDYVVRQQDDRVTLLIPLAALKSKHEANVQLSQVKVMMMYADSYEPLSLTGSEGYMSLGYVSFAKDDSLQRSADVASLVMQNDRWVYYSQAYTMPFEGDILHVDPVYPRDDRPPEDAYTKHLFGCDYTRGAWIVNNMTASTGGASLAYRYHMRHEVDANGELVVTPNAGAPLELGVSADMRGVASVAFDLYLSGTPDELAALQLQEPYVCLMQSKNAADGLYWSCSDLAQYAEGGLKTGWNTITLPLSLARVKGAVDITALGYMIIHPGVSAQVDETTDLTLRVDGIRLLYQEARPEVENAGYYLTLEGERLAVDVVERGSSGYFNGEMPLSFAHANPERQSGVYIFGGGYGLSGWTRDAYNKTVGRYSISHDFSMREVWNEDGSVTYRPTENVLRAQAEFSLFAYQLEGMGAVEFDLYISDLDNLLAANFDIACVQILGADASTMTWGLNDLLARVEGGARDGWNRVHLSFASAREGSMPIEAMKSLRFIFSRSAPKDPQPLILNLDHIIAVPAKPAPEKVPEEPRFTIRFMNGDGKVISEQRLLEGELPIAPDAEDVRMADGSTFVGWDAELAPASADVDYHPVYQLPEVSTEQPSPPETSEDPKPSNAFNVMWIILPCALLVLVGAVAGVMIWKRRRSAA
ncbi:MAG: hypothetical protein IJY66_04790 [Clostridia bacterium]|nr:hypothetical protein [Clostridia bacterium]